MLPSSPSRLPEWVIYCDNGDKRLIQSFREEWAVRRFVTLVLDGEKFSMATSPFVLKTVSGKTVRIEGVPPAEAVARDMAL